MKKILPFYLLFITSLSCHAQQLITSSCDFLPKNFSAEGVQCGFIVVPEDHHNSNGKKIRVAYAILKRKDSTSKAFPVLYLSGGPGSETLNSIRIWVNSPFREKRDIILLDHRGIGYSSPLPNIGPDIMDITFSDASIAKEEVMMKEAMASFKKKNNLKEEQLALYNIYQVADDIGQLMDALGYKKYNLYGVSYGTRLGMILMHKFSAKISSAILYGLAAPQMDALAQRIKNLTNSFSNLFEQCARDSACKVNYPTLEADYNKMIESLMKEPIHARLNGKPFAINPQDAIYLLRYQMYLGDALVRTPALIKAFINRDTTFINRSQQFYTAVFTSANITMNYCSEIYDNYTDNTIPLMLKYLNEAKNAQTKMAVNYALAKNARNWHYGQASAQEKNISGITTPTLLLSNQFDPACPPMNAIEAKKSFINSTFIVFDEYGHVTRSDCKDKLYIDFFDNPDGKFDMSCLKLIRQ